MTTSHDQLVAQIHHALWDRSATETQGSLSAAGDLDEQIRCLIAEHQPLASPAAIAAITAEVMARVDGLGPLHELASEPEVSEIMVNGDGHVWIERSGRVERSGLALDQADVGNLIRRLAASAGRRIDLTHPSVDVRLADGSRLHAIIPPLAIDGPCMTIRRFTDRHIDLADMADASAQRILRSAVTNQNTIIVAGATASGKTTMLNALAGSIDDDARIITIEDAAELRLPAKHVVRLETRAASEGVAAVTLRELARHALRMRPDRIICGEMRGAEALDLIQAMNTGHPGSMSTVHANTPADALRRIETMMLLGDAELPLAAIREQLASCIDLILMMGRVDGGGRAVLSIAEVPDRPGDGWSLQHVYDRSQCSETAAA